jgi:hypothetical protein
VLVLCWDNNVLFLPFPYRIYSLPIVGCGYWCKIKMMSNVWFFIWKFITEGVRYTTSNKMDHYHKKDKDGKRMVKIKISQESC